MINSSRLFVLALFRHPLSPQPDSGEKICCFPNAFCPVQLETGSQTLANYCARLKQMPPPFDGVG